MKSGHYFERFFCNRWKWLITKLMRCNFFDYFSKSAGIFGSKAGEIDLFKRRARQTSTKFSEFSQRESVGEKWSANVTTKPTRPTLNSVQAIVFIEC